MKCKKLNAVLLTAAIAAVPLSGCSSDKSMASTENKDSDGVLELTYYNADTNKDDPWTDPVALAITDATGVKLTTSYPVSDAAEDISLMIADDKYPDIIYSKGFANNLVEAGALIDLTDLIEEYGPNIKKYTVMN